MPRRLGQHFLANQSILEQIAVAACGERTPRVIEIGPGRGALTRHLLARTDELHAVELDSALAARLEAEFASEAKVHIHRGDVLKTDLTAWGPAVVTGNLPYYITSPILERFGSLGAGFPRGVFLIQAEVAARLTAQPGSRDYGYLTVATRLRCTVELVCRVPASAFRPRPKVESAAVRLVRKPQTPDNMTGLLVLASRAFAHKRKTLRNNLRPFYGAAIDAQPEASLRAEQLSIEDFISLEQRLAPVH